MKYFVVGDIHGCMDKLTQVLSFWKKDEERLVFLGDLVDRGPDSLDVILKVMDLRVNHDAIVLKGNHEDLFLNWLKAPDDESDLYLNQGGAQTIDSFFGKRVAYQQSPSQLAKYIQENFSEEIDCLSSMKLFHETEKHIFVHAGVDLHMKDWKNTNEKLFNWIRNPFIYGKNETGKTIIFGHTPTRTIHPDKVDDVWYSPCHTKIGIDGGAVFGGKLHALRINEETTEYEVVSA